MLLISWCGKQSRSRRVTYVTVHIARVPPYIYVPTLLPIRYPRVSFPTHFVLNVPGTTRTHDIVYCELLERWVSETIELLLTYLWCMHAEQWLRVNSVWWRAVHDPQGDFIKLRIITDNKFVIPSIHTTQGWARSRVEVRYRCSPQ